MSTLAEYMMLRNKLSKTLVTNSGFSTTAKVTEDLPDVWSMASTKLIACELGARVNRSTKAATRHRELRKTLFLCIVPVCCFLFKDCIFDSYISFIIFRFRLRINLMIQR